MYVVLFDIDGTLIQTGGAGRLAFSAAFRDEFGVPNLSRTVPFAGRSDRAIVGDLMEIHGISPTIEHWRRFQASYLERLPGALARRRGKILPGVAEFIAALHERDDVVTGLLTGNIRAGAQAKLGHYGLDRHFDFGGFGDEATDRCAIARSALAEATRHVRGRLGERSTPHASDERAGETLRGVMVLGDTIHDIRCARAIGATAVALPTGETPASTLAGADPDVLLDDLSDFSRLMEFVSL